MRRVEDAVIRIETELPHLATREMVADLRAQVGRIETQLPHLATKDELAGIRLIRWIIGVGVAAVFVFSAQLWGAAQLLLRLSGHQ